jgi:hypothetical protein
MCGDTPAFQLRAVAVAAQFKWESGRVDVTKLPAPNHGGKRGGPKASTGKGGGSKGGAAATPAQHSQQAPAGLLVHEGRSQRQISVRVAIARIA